MVSYITRINHEAIISEMVRDTGYTKDVLSLSLTGMFITYGSGQIISVLLADRISPKKLVTIGLSLSVLMNILVPLCGSAASTYGIALISEKSGWTLTLLIWFIIALAGTVICFASARPWNKKMGE